MKGGQEMIANIKNFATKYPDRVGKALYAEALPIMTASKQICPVMPTKAQLKALGRSLPKDAVPGALRASGKVSEPVRAGRSVTVTLSYGGAASAYAVVQHERTDFHHVNGEAKYLEKPLYQDPDGLLTRLGTRLHFDNTSDD